MTRELYSERAGRARTLSKSDFMNLLWAQYLRMRAERFFGPGLAGDEFLGTGDESPVSESALIRRFNVSGLRSELRADFGVPPGWRTDDVPLLFDIFEYLHDEVTHEEKRAELRQRLNPDLALYTPPMEMLANGQIVEKVLDELDPLVSEPVADEVPAEFADPLTHAIEQFRRREASVQDKRSALRQLAGVLEPLKGEIGKHVLPSDESALFQIANKFAIRHTNREQQREYDTEVWLDWMFYVYVATARAMLAMLKREELEERVAPTDDLAF
jgi:hypothetical protein